MYRVLLHLAVNKRHHMLLLSAFLVAAVASGVLSARASAEENGTISGTVVNETTDQPLTGASVIISRFDDPSDPQSVDTSVVTDANGHFTATGLETNDGFAYVASVSYEDVLYSSDMILLSREPQQSIELKVYEPTSDQSAISVGTRGIIVTGIDQERGLITFTDVYSIRVDGERTIVSGDDGRTVRFSVPHNALEVRPGRGFNFGSPTVEGSTIFATSPIRPGGTTASLEYVLPYQQSSLTLPIVAEYSTEALRVLVPSGLVDDNLSLSSDGATLTDLGVVPVEGREYHVWSADRVAADETLSLTLSGLPKSAISERRLRTLEPAAIAALSLLVASGVTAGVVAKRGLHRSSPVAVVPAMSVPIETRRDELADQLRRLESDRQDGLVDEAVYSLERRSILEELRRISRQSRGIPDVE